MKKRLTLPAQVVCVVIAVLLLSLHASAQHRSQIDVQEWPAGKVVLTTGDTIYGPLTFHRTQEIVTVHNEDGTISSFSPVNVQYFVAQEQPSNRSYIFRTLMWDLGRDYSDFKKPTFFEQLNQGSFTLVMRETYVQRDVHYASSRQGYSNDPYLNPLGNYYLDQINELYYILLPDGEVVTLRNVRKDLHKLFGKKSKQVKKFVKSRKLDYVRPHELMSIVNYYNSL